MLFLSKNEKVTRGLGRGDLKNQKKKMFFGRKLIGEKKKTTTFVVLVPCASAGDTHLLRGSMASRVARVPLVPLKNPPRSPIGMKRRGRGKTGTRDEKWRSLTPGEGGFSFSFDVAIGDPRTY